MTVLTESLAVEYASNGVARSFAIPFPYIEPEHLRVTSIAPSGVIDLLVIGGHYTVSEVAGDDNGNTVELLEDTELPAGCKLRIERRMPYVQPTDFLHQGAFLPETNELSHDRTVMLIQQLLAQIGALEQVVAVVQYSDADHGAGIVARSSGGQDAATNAALPLDGVAINDGNAFNAETFTFTAPATGRYRVHATATGQVADPSERAQIGLRYAGDLYPLVKGSVGAPAQDQSIGWVASSQFTFTVDLDAGDQVVAVNLGNELSLILDARLEIARV